MRRCENFSNFFFATKTSNIGAHFEPTINSFEANPLEKSTAAETSKFWLSIIFKNCPRHFWRSGLRFSRPTRRALQFGYKTSKSKKIKFSQVILRPLMLKLTASFLKICPVVFSFHQDEPGNFEALKILWFELKKMLSVCQCTSGWWMASQSFKGNDRLSKNLISSYLGDPEKLGNWAWNSLMTKTFKYWNSI